MTLDDDADLPLDGGDTRLLTALAEVQDRFDAPPPGLVERLLFAISLDLMSAELATLEGGVVAGVRGGRPMTADTVTFTASGLSLMLVLTEVDGGVRVDGWVTGGGVTVEAHAGPEPEVQVSDATGRLSWPRLPHGPVRFLIRPPREGDRPVITPSIEV